MTGFLKGLALCAAMSLPCAAPAATINYTIDAGGITFDGVTITGGFLFDTDTQTSSDFMLNVSGAGTRDGDYEVATIRNSAGSLAVAKAGSGSDLTGADVVDMIFSSTLLGSGGPSISFVGLGNCSSATCSGISYAFDPVLQEDFPGGTVTGVEVGAQVPLPAGLPLLLGGLGIFGVMRARRKAAAA